MEVELVGWRKGEVKGNFRSFLESMKSVVPVKQRRSKLEEKVFHLLLSINIWNL